MHFGEQVLYDNASFQIGAQDRIGLVGPNGAGKTTVFRLLTGENKPSQGTISIPKSLVMGYFSQDVGEMAGRSALEEVKSGAGKVSEIERALHECEKALEDSAINAIDDSAMEKLLERYGEAQLEYERLDGYGLQARAEAILTGLGIKPEDHKLPVETFSGGWKMRIALAKILALQPGVLLMDEPTNHLDVESIVWLEEWLSNYPGALIMTSHDRDFMNRLVNKIVEVANKNITTYKGDYEFYLREREIRREQLLASHKKQEDMLAKENEFIARFAARASHAAQVQSRVKKLEKIERIEIPSEARTVKFDFPPSPRSGNDVVRIDQLSKKWEKDDGSSHWVFQNATMTVRRLEKIAVVGVNGAGKSTLLKCIAGQTTPTTGSLSIGSNVMIGYFSQHALEVLNPEKTLLEHIHDVIPDASLGYVRNLLGAFLFSGDDAHKKISVLSGGEKSRIVLATILALPRNLLILDEPTNHLDIVTRELLLSAIQKFEGTVLIVSHDRHFLRECATKVIEVDRGEVRVIPKTYAEYWAHTHPSSFKA